MAKFGVYRNYQYLTKDPICGSLKTMIRSDEHLKNKDVSALSGVSATTVHGWLDGPTVRPQNATITAVAASLGYVRRDSFNSRGQVEVAFVKVADLDYKREMEKQADWILKQDRKKKPRKKRKAKANGT